MTDKLAELRAMEKAGTPGPCLLSPNPLAPEITTAGPEIVISLASSMGPANAILFAAARNALPALLDVAEAAAGFVRTAAHPTLGQHDVVVRQWWDTLRTALARLEQS